MNYLIGDIGNTNIKICKINSKFKIVNTYIFETKNYDLEKNLKKKLKLLLKKNTNKNILFSSVVPAIYKRISKILNQRNLMFMKLKNST